MLRRKNQVGAINWLRVNKILLIRLRSMGDIILMTPIISSLKKWKPALNLTVLIEHRFNALLEGNPLIDSIINSKIPAGNKNSFSDLELLLGGLYRQKFDMVINLHGGTRSTLQTMASLAPYRVAPEYFRYNFIYNIKTPHPQIVWQTKEPLHTVQNQLSFIKALRIPISDCEITVPCSAKTEEEVKKKLASLGVDVHKPFVVIHPGASLLSKKWSTDNFAHLSDWLIDKFKLQVLIITSPQEKEVMDEILMKVKHKPFSWFGPSLKNLIAIIKACSLFVGNDAGPTHIAAAFKKPIVVIFGSSSHNRWHPWKTSYSLIRHSLPCSPCPGKKCYNNTSLKCIRSITLEEVKEGVKEQLVNIA
jgi:predicted lipopolysaccharide heptosyltransferase III